MAFAAVGALFSGIAAGTAVAATTALMAVSTIGAVMSVAGAVTGNKGLMKVGAVMGLVGGVGGLISGATAGAAGAVAGEVVGESAAGSVFNAAADSQLANVAIDAASGAGTAAAGYGIDAGAAFQAAGGGWAEAATDALKTFAEASPMEAVESSSSAYTNQMDAASDAFSGGKTPNAGGLSSGDTLKSLTTDAKVSDINPLDKYAGSSSNPNAANYVNQMDAASDAVTSANSKDYFKGILEWVKQNDKLANNIMTVGAGALKGVSERSMFDEKMALEKSRYQYGNTVAKPYSAQPLIGAR